LHRKINLEKCLETTKGLKAISPVEIATTLVSAIRGNHKILPIFGLARDNKKYTSYSLEERPLVIIDCWDNYLSSNEGVLFKKQFIESINIDENEGSVLFDLAFSLYLKGQKNKKKDYYHMLVFMIGKLVKKTIPSKLYQKASYLYKSLTFFLNRHSNHDWEGYPYSSIQGDNDWEMIKEAIIRNNDYDNK